MSGNNKEKFMSMYEELSKFLLDDVIQNFEMPEYVVTWLSKLVNNSVLGGKMNRGISVVDSLVALKPECSETEIKCAIVAGWCVEWLQAFFLVADDIMDKSEMRRGVPCWYLQPKPMDKAEGEQIGIIACNDSFILESMIYRLLKVYLKGVVTSYCEILELFHEVTYQTELGQLLDLTSQPNSKKNDINLFTLETYVRIAKYKTAFYSFYLPVALAMHIIGGFTEVEFTAIREVLLDMGIFFQIQDDYLDCYGTYEQIGKIGRDIEENKCGWLIVKTLENCDATQRSVVEKHYGHDDPQSVAEIKKLYAEVGIPSIYHTYEEESYTSITTLISQIPKPELQLCLKQFLQKIYKRNH